MSAYTILLVNLSTLRGERLAENIALMHSLETGTECTVADALIQMDVDAKWLEQYGDTKITDDNIGDPFLRGAIKKRKNEKGEEDTVYSGIRLSKYQAAASMTPVIPDYFSILRSMQEGSTLSEKNGKSGPDTAGKYGDVYGIQTNEASLKLVLQDTDIDELIIMATGAVYGSSLAMYRGKRIGNLKNSGKDASENSNSRTIDANGHAPEMVAKGILAECLDNSLKRTGGNCCLEIEDIKDYRLFDGEKDVTEDITKWSNTLDYYILEAAYYAQKGASDKEKPHGKIQKIVIYPIRDNPEQKEEITDCAIRIAQRTIAMRDPAANGLSGRAGVDDNTSAKRELRLFIDSNGGKREAIIIQIGILRALQEQGVGPEAILYADYNPGSERWKRPVKVYDKQAEYEIFDIVSGIDEFVEYGRVGKLRQYFEHSQSGICKVLDCIQNMCDAFTTCFANPMVESVAEAARALQAFLQPDDVLNSSQFVGL